MDDVRATTSAIASGDTEAFARLYSAKFDMMLRTAQTRTGLGESDCLDIVQDSMLKALYSMRVFKEAHSLDAWLRRVTTNVALDRIRAERRRARREKAVTADRDQSVPSPQLDERIRIIREQMRTLDRASADLLDMRYRMGMTLTAIGARLGLKPGAVDGRIRRSLETLRHRMEEADND